MPSIDQSINFIISNKYTLALVLGFLVGLISRILMPGRDPMGIIMTSVLGICGSFIGAYGAQYAGVELASFASQIVASILGSFALLAVYKLIRNV